MSLGGNSTDVVGLVALCEDPEQLQPFYLMLLTSSLKVVMTAMIFGIDVLKDPVKLKEEWEKRDTLSQMKRVAGIGMQLLFIALALNTFIADAREVAGYAHGQTPWQRYTCFVLKWNTSTNMVAALASFFPWMGLMKVLIGDAPELDPRPFGRLHKVHFSLKCAYCFGLAYLVGAPAMITWFSHWAVGFCTLSGIAVYELLKFIYFSFWRDLLTRNWKLLLEDASLLWTFLYPFAIMMLGIYLGVPIEKFLLFWHGRQPTRPEEVQPLRTAVAVEDETTDQRQLVLNDEPAGPHQHPVLLVLYAIAMPVEVQMGTVIAARIYQGDGVYAAIAKTVSERTLHKYLTHTRAQVSAAGASMQRTVDVVLRAVWALL